MCLIPITAGFCFLYLIVTHEKVTCMNYAEVNSFLARHREQVADDESEGHEKRRAYLDKIHAAAESCSTAGRRFHHGPRLAQEAPSRPVAAAYTTSKTEYLHTRA